MGKKRWRAVAVLLLMPLVLTGCLFGPEEKTSRQIDPPPDQAKADAQPVGAMNEKKTEAQKEQGKTADTQLYLLSHTGHVVPWTVKIPAGKSVAKTALEYMVKGGPGEAMLPKGISPILPKGTKVKGINIENGTAVVDFSKEFLQYEADKEEQLLNAVTWTLTGFSNVKEVNIWVDGKKLSEMPKNKTTAQGLTRGRGINLEPVSGVHVTRSMPVTVYFLGQTDDHQVYYVPVTRMVERSDNVAEAVLGELIRGPLEQSGLSGALAPSLQVLKVQEQGDVVTADFDEALLQYHGQQAASKEALQSIVLSLTENTQASKVKITVQGKQQVLTGKDQPLSQPVSRPKWINPAQL
ncbi:GerMN domain-containing protein [Staphylospora marina]|uniref:GerMN domain-containing protein n=1 Tax=Staphylospora marina TaxID=2490858 RepID=UPI000F5B9BED|nr:GerMN domain-containing protein [Staphylospora marina]